MAKGAKSFSDKLKKKSETQTKRIRIIRSVKSPDTGAVRFLDNMAVIPSEGDIGEHVKKHLQENA